MPRENSTTQPRREVVLSLALLAALFTAILALAAFSDLFGNFSPVAVLVIGALALVGPLLLVGRYLHRLFERLERMGLIDTLSQLPNRRAVHIDIAREAEPGSEVAIALIGLDRFKKVNDSHGHVVGDSAVRAFADILRETCGEEARCYRLGGDEFAVSLIGPIAGTLLEGLCRSLIERLRRPLRVDGRTLSIGASIGLASSTGRDDLDSSELLRRADIAMSASKRGGRMRCTWFTEKLDQSRARLAEIDDELRLALANDEFELHYQPLVDAETKEIVAVEALLRWNRLEGEPIGPNVFIPVAEESGLINPIGLWVLRRGFTDLLEYDDVRLSVNISATQLRDIEFPIQLGQLLEDTGFPPERLELEITETSLVLDPVVAERSLDVIREFGVKIALDDFGTGYASIGFLRRFRFHKLKLDRSLVVDAEDDESSRAMMLSSVTMARALTMNVTAEGVETEAQAQLVRAAGCDQIQGWLYYRALPHSELKQILDGRESVADHTTASAERLQS